MSEKTKVNTWLPPLPFCGETKSVVLTGGGGGGAPVIISWAWVAGAWVTVGEVAVMARFQVLVGVDGEVVIVRVEVPLPPVITDGVNVPETPDDNGFNESVMFWLKPFKGLAVTV